MVTALLLHDGLASVRSEKDRGLERHDGHVALVLLGRRAILQQVDASVKALVRLAHLPLVGLEPSVQNSNVRPGRMQLLQVVSGVVGELGRALLDLGWAVVDVGHPVDDDFLAGGQALVAGAHRIDLADRLLEELGGSLGCGAEPRWSALARVRGGRGVVAGEGGSLPEKHEHSAWPARAAGFPPSTRASCSRRHAIQFPKPTAVMKRRPPEPFGRRMAVWNCRGAFCPGGCGEVGIRAGNSANMPGEARHSGADPAWTRPCFPAVGPDDLTTGAVLAGGRGGRRHAHRASRGESGGVAGGEGGSQGAGP